MNDCATTAADGRHPALKNPAAEGVEGGGRGPGVPAVLTEDGRRKTFTQNSDFMDAVGTASLSEAGDFEEEEDRPRFCSLDPPSDVYRKASSRSGHVSLHEEPRGPINCGQVIPIGNDRRCCASHRDLGAPSLLIYNSEPL